MKTTQKHQVGDVIKVYQDPVTKEKLEGEAKIIEVCNAHDCYVVRFTNEPDSHYTRVIY